MVYVASDIHGYDTRYRSILEQIQLKPEDHLYILGDVIDRFPDGLCILQEIMSASNISMLLGNHEYMMLDALTNPENMKPMERWYWNGGDITHDYFLRCNRIRQTEILEFIQSLPLSFDISVNGIDYHLVHGSPLSAFEYQTSYDDETKHMVWSRLKQGHPLPPGKTVIFGHTPTCHYQMDDPMRIWFGEKMIGIDCGCGYEVEGRLACLRLDDMKEFYSEEGL